MTSAWTHGSEVIHVSKSSDEIREYFNVDCEIFISNPRKAKIKPHAPNFMSPYKKMIPWFIIVSTWQVHKPLLMGNNSTACEGACAKPLKVN